MSDQQAKKLSLALHLNPAVSDADRAAMEALRQWYETARQSCGGERAELDGMIRLFHHDLYLAGLRLYLIDPRLCRHVAEALDQADLTLDGLAGQLSARGLWSETPDTFSARQLEQLEGLLAATSPAAAATGAAPDEALTRQLKEQGKQLAAMQAELKTLRGLAEEQAELLRQGSPAPAKPRSSKKKTSGGGGAEEMDVSGMKTQIAQIQKIRKKGVL